MKPVIILAMDRASVRRVDRDGHMHVEISNIAKVGRNPYYGNEIPGWQELGLDASRVYWMRRSADALAKAVDSANGKPLLIRHKPVHASDHPRDLTVGTTGTAAQFDGTYIKNALSVWDVEATDGIVFDERRELSPGYHYTPVMGPCDFEGLPCDGDMIDIGFNHVALVVEGRQGPDVIVGDENMLKSRAALMVQGAMAAYISPKLAAGQKVDITVAMDGANAAMFADDKKVKAFAGKIVGLADGKLAQDQTIDADGIVAVISAMAFDEANDEIKDPVPAPEPKKDPVDPPNPNPNPDPKPADPPAMDQAAVDRTVSAAVAATEKRFAAIRAAERETVDVIGDVTCDSAEDYYKMALDEMGADLEGVTPAAYGSLFRSLRKNAREPIAQDAKPMLGMLDKIAPDRATLN